MGSGVCLEAKDEVDLKIRSLDGASIEVAVCANMHENLVAAKEQAPVEEVQQCEQRVRPGHVVLENLEVESNKACCSVFNRPAWCCSRRQSG
jgi:hypothetical protein